MEISLKCFQRVLNLSDNDMEYDHLFAGSDVEENDVRPVSPFPAQSHHSQTGNNFVCGPFPTTSNRRGRYWRHDCVKFTEFPNRVDRVDRQARKNQVAGAQINGKRGPEDYRPKRYPQDVSVDFKKRKSEVQRNDKVNKQQPDNQLSVAGPSRIMDHPVDYRLILILIDANFMKSKFSMNNESDKFVWLRTLKNFNVRNRKLQHV